MNGKEFLISILEYFISNIPSLIISLTTIVAYLKKVKTKVSDFDLKVVASESKIVKTVESKVKDTLDFMEEKFDKSITRVDTFLYNVNKTVDDVSNEVKTYGDKIKGLQSQVEYMFKTNKVAFDIIGLLVGKNPELIEKGVSSMVLNKLNFTQEELKNYPKLLIEDKNIFAKALKEQMFLMGKDKIMLLVENTFKEIEDGKKQQ